LLVWVRYIASPVSPTPDCITIKFRVFIGGIQVALAFLRADIWFVIG
jgi:hypothetical protein